jgi:CheY-like chemotaxis protein
MQTHKLKILAVDDTEVNLDLLKRFISRQGHDMIMARNGLEAVERFQTEQPDLVLMDVTMPDMDGYEATRRIRKLCGERWVPIVFMSANTTIEDQVRGLDSGGDDYLTKPLSMRILGAKINAMQRIAEMQQALERYAAELKHYRDRAEDEKRLANRLMEGMTLSSSLGDTLLQSWVFPAEHMSGDLVAACRTEDDRLYIMVADATGHGLPAALLQLPVSQTFYDMASVGYSVASIVSAMNRRLRDLIPRDRFVATTVVMVDTRNHLIEIWNGGNPEALLVDTGGHIVHRFVPRATPLGVLSPDEFESYSEVYQWRDSSELLIYSDGVLDADDPQGELFGEQRLEAVVAADGCVFQSLKDAVRAHLAGRHGQDDISVVSVRCLVG